MKSMNFLEFQGGVDRLRKLVVGSQFQDFSLNDKDLLLLFYANKSLTVRLSLRTPPVFFIETADFKLEKNIQKVPLALFLSKHFLRKKVVDVKYRDEWGRRFEIHLEDENKNSYVIEITLVPGFQNVALHVNDGGKDKRVYWNKPRELGELTEESKSDVSEFRSLDIIRDEWYSEKKYSPKKTNVAVMPDWQLDIQKKIKKKTEAIEKIKQQNLDNESHVVRLYEIGELLKYQTMEQLDESHRMWLKQHQPKDVDREHIFKKAKVLAAKKNGMAERIGLLLKEIQMLTKSLEGSPPQPKHKISPVSQGSVDTRKLEVSSSLNLYMGKNAKDNVQLLKSSQPWELWFHLKDYPSAYAITRRNKTVVIGHAELLMMATWFAKECLRYHKEKTPHYIEVIYTECRFVKLLKGDKLGRVTYANAKTLRVSTT